MREWSRAGRSVRDRPELFVPGAYRLQQEKGAPHHSGVNALKPDLEGSCSRLPGSRFGQATLEQLIR